MALIVQKYGGSSVSDAGSIKRAIGRAEVAAVLREICRGLTVLLVDHDLAFICQFADWICCLEQGIFTDVGSPAELASRPGLFRILLEENAFYLKGPGVRKSTPQKSKCP